MQLVRSLRDQYKNLKTIDHKRDWFDAVNGQSVFEFYWNFPTQKKEEDVTNSVTRWGNLLYLGQLFKAFGNNFSIEIIFGQLL